MRGKLKKGEKKKKEEKKKVEKKKSGNDGENPSPFTFSALSSLRHHSEVKIN